MMMMMMMILQMEVVDINEIMIGNWIYLSHDESVIKTCFFNGILALKVQPYILNAAALFRVKVDLNMNKHLTQRHTSLIVPFFFFYPGARYYDTSLFIIGQHTWHWPVTQVTVRHQGSFTAMSCVRILILHFLLVLFIWDQSKQRSLHEGELDHEHHKVGLSVFTEPPSFIERRTCFCPLVLVRNI